MNHLNDKNFIRKHDQIKQEIVLNDTFKTKGKLTQNESQFKGVDFPDSKFTFLWILALSGPLGLIYPLIISISKKKSVQGFKELYYSQYSRTKAERVTVLAIIMTVIYAFTWFHIVQRESARELEKKFEQSLNIYSKVSL